MVYAACEDRLYAAEEDEHLAYIERFVEGVLPYKTMRYLLNTEQLWDFDADTIEWEGWQLVLMKHRSWITTTMNTLQRAHTLSHPLQAVLSELENVIEFCEIQSNNHRNANRIVAYQESLPQFAQQSILSLEMAYLQSLCIPFPRDERGPFHPEYSSNEAFSGFMIEGDESE